MKKLNKLLIFLLVAIAITFENCSAKPITPGIELLPTKNLYISYIFCWTIFLGIGILVYWKFRNDKPKNYKRISLVIINFVSMSITGLVIFLFMAKDNEYFYYSKGSPVIDTPIFGEYTYVFLTSGFILVFNIILIILLSKKSNVKRTILTFLLPILSIIYFNMLCFLIMLCFFAAFWKYIILGHLTYCICVFLNFISIIGVIKFVFGKSKGEEVDKIECNKNMKIIILTIIVLLFFSGILMISEPKYLLYK